MKNLRGIDDWGDDSSVFLTPEDAALVAMRVTGDSNLNASDVTSVLRSLSDAAGQYVRQVETRKTLQTTLPSIQTIVLGALAIYLIASKKR